MIFSTETADRLRTFSDRGDQRVLVCLAFMSLATTQPGSITVVGGADSTGQVYAWTVRNNASTPITGIEIPHYQAGVFIAPEGWTTDESTHLVRAGHQMQPGVCVAHASSPAVWISPGSSAILRIQLAPRGARRGRGEITVHFADGTRIKVANVELPQPESTTDRFASLIGLGVIAIAAIGIKAIRSRRHR